jgi:23S rRNA (uridine2552-2'-O)-methyltransferase
MKQTKSRGKKWEDHYSRQAKKDGFPARSAYKLQEIQKKFNIIRKGDQILDLGCAPGSWLIFAAKTTGPKGRVTGIDLKPVTVRLPEQAKALTGDVRELDDAAWEKPGRAFDVVLSDMAPATTGNRVVDAARSLGLCETALDIAQQRLRIGGSFVCKIFQGGDVNAFLDEVRKRFNKCKTFKPRSSRKASKEIFIIGFGKKPSKKGI